MDFVASQRIRSQLAPTPSRDGPSHQLPVPVFVSVKRRKRIRQFACCKFEGFYEAESHPRIQYLWTKKAATICCQFPETTALKYVWIEIAATAPQGTNVTLSWDDAVIAEATVRGRTTLRGQLPETQRVNEVNLTIANSTFVPQLHDMGDDPRELGVAVSGIVFGKRSTKYRNGLAFERPIIERITNWIPRFRSRAAA